MKAKIVKLLKTCSPHVAETYPSSFAKLPVVIYEEEQNRLHTLTPRGERMSLYRYRVEIYSDTSTSAVKAKISEAMTAAGWLRIQSTDTNDPSGLRHTTMRFEGIVDNVTGRIYHL